MTQIDYQTAARFLPFRSQRGGLIAFGIVFIIIGLFVLLAALMLPLAAMVGPAQSVNWRTLLPLELIYLLSAGVCIFAGIENIRTRRWIRPVGIVCGGMGLLGGILGVAMMAVQWKQVMTAASQGSGGAGTTPMAVNIGIAVGLGFVSIFYIVLPALVFWFYRRPDVLRTVRHFDPSPSWTDDKPLSLIAAIIVEWVMAVSIPMMLMYDVFPLFNMLVHGAPAAMLYLLLCGGHLIAALLLFRRHVAGIWLAMILPVFQMASTTTALARHGFDAVFRQPDFFVQPGVPTYRPPPPDMMVIYVLWGIMLIAWCAFLLFTRRWLTLIPADPLANGAAAQPR